MLVIGITGPTGCGKTTLLQCIAARGGYTLDCDALYYELLASNEGIALRRELQAAFPDAFGADGSLRRKALGQLVFGDKARMAQLNEIVFFHVGNANVLEENVVRHFNTVNLGFACDTPRGLIVPTIFNADQMTLLELSMEAKRLAAEAREGKLSPDYMSGATFTISNIGSFGCEAFTPVINPPQTGILGVCNIQTKIKSAKDGVIETYPAMGLSLTFDHRVIDGAPAARYMSELCKSLENFMTLLAK